MGGKFTGRKTKHFKTLGRGGMVTIYCPKTDKEYSAEPYYFNKRDLSGGYGSSARFCEFCDKMLHEGVDDHADDVFLDIAEGLWADFGITRIDTVRLTAEVIDGSKPGKLGAKFTRIEPRREKKKR